ncbi:MAG TPA: nucleotidyltransferase domain-containing protein [Candidatus Limnocylindria bacterium]|nr:nucleotidyltransferase domain-containing protein [Candidatus Limnocylindria bacterium]
MEVDTRLHRIVAAQPYPLLFATISGAHLYGFPSPDSDFDLRGAHVLPLPKVVGLETTGETVEDARIIEGLEMDIVSHDVAKFFGMLLKKNGYVLEQLFSPLVVRTTTAHAELMSIAGPGAQGPGVITRFHAHHYFGFAETQWKLFLKESPRRVKPLLYVFRVLLTGIHLMRTGRVESNLVTLNQEEGLGYIPDLIDRKTRGENTTLAETDVQFFESEYERLRQKLQSAQDATQLPDAPAEAVRAAINDLLIRLRIHGL